MLAILLAHIIITAVCLCSGFLFYNFFSVKIGARPLIFCLLSGLILLTLITQIITLFFPVSIFVQLVLPGTLIISALVKKRDLKFLIEQIQKELRLFSHLSSSLFFLSWLIILVISAGPLMMDDTESYHIQSIKWIKEYGSVPGLVNLHERFGFNSSWFSSAALFSYSSATTGGFTVLNSILSLWFCFWFISKINKLTKDRNPKPALVILLVFTCCLALWPMIRGNAATANYDFITMVMVFVLFTESFLSQENNYSFHTEWIIWAAYLFTIRVINFPLLLSGLWALFYLIKQNKFKTVFLHLAICLLLILPFLTRNIILTGYPFYPALYFDCFNADWKADAMQTEKLLEYIKYFNRVPTTYLDLEQTKALGANWIPIWFRHLFTYDKIVVLTGITGLLIGIAMELIKKGKSNRSTVIIIAVLIVWLICWFIISPDPRFVYGGLLAGLLIVFFSIASKVNFNNIYPALLKIIMIIMVSASAFYFISKTIRHNEYRNWLRPAKLPEPPVKEITIEGIIFRIPERINNNWNARCYGTDLPCLYKIDARLKPRGKTISDGFRLEK
jgi:hypothetical protein